MKSLLNITVALALLLTATPVLAGEQSPAQMKGTEISASFQAFSNINSHGEKGMTPMSDEELAMVEGSFSLTLTAARILYYGGLRLAKAYF
jgi:hypothetical protein